MVFLLVRNNNKIEDNKARQIGPKIPSISSYQGKFACQLMVKGINNITSSWRFLWVSVFEYFLLTKMIR